MKKLLCLLLALVFLAASFAAFAEEEEAAMAIEFPKTGVLFIVPEVFESAKGILVNQPYDYGEITDGILMGVGSYLGHTTEEDAAVSALTQDLSEPEAQEIWDEFRDNTVELFFVYGVSDGKTFEDAVERTLGLGAHILPPTELGESNGYDYYVTTLDFSAEDVQNYIRNFAPELKAEVAELAAYVMEHPECFEFTDIDEGFPFAQPGTHVSFEAEDLDGNAVSSDELFAANKVTMVNIWRTWCGFCVEEFPEIEEMSKAWAEKGGAVITYCADAKTEDLIEKARDLTADFSFRTLAHSDSFDAALPHYGTPCTYFVDSVPEEGETSAYTALVVDQNGDPVPGACLTFCNANSCNLVTADENGVATFEGVPFAYHVQVVDLPDGYTETGADYYTDLKPGSMIVVVNKD